MSADLMGIPADYADAVDNAGWTNGRQTYERGYVSRRLNPDRAPLHRSPRGEWYVLLASNVSTRYCVRQYLIPCATA